MKEDFGKINAGVVSNFLDEYEDLRFITIKQFCLAFPWPTESGLRAYIFRANDLGISDAFIRVGRRVLVDPKKFFILIKQLHNCFTKGESHDSNESNKRRTNNQIIQNK